MALIGLLASCQPGPPATPELRLAVAEGVTLRKGGNSSLTVRAQRLNGLSGPVELRLENPPTGVSAERVTLAADGDVAQMRLTAGPDAAVGGPVRVTVYGQTAPQTVARTAFDLTVLPDTAPVIERIEPEVITLGRDQSLVISGTSLGNVARVELVADLTDPATDASPVVGAAITERSDTQIRATLRVKRGWNLVTQNRRLQLTTAGNAQKSRPIGVFWGDYRVDARNGDDGEATNPIGQGPFRTLQRALSFCGAREVRVARVDQVCRVLARADIYRVASTLTIPAETTLSVNAAASVGALGISKVIISGPGRGVAGSGVIVESGAVLDYTQIESFAVGLTLLPGASATRIEDTDILDNGVGVRTSGGVNAVLSKVSVIRNELVGLILLQSLEAPKLTLQDCGVASNGGNGITVENGEVVLDNCDVTLNSGNGVALFRTGTITFRFTPGGLRVNRLQQNGGLNLLSGKRPDEGLVDARNVCWEFNPAPVLSETVFPEVVGLNGCGFIRKPFRDKIDENGRTIRAWGIPVDPAEKRNYANPSGGLIQF